MNTVQKLLLGSFLCLTQVAFVQAAAPRDDIDASTSALVDVCKNASDSDAQNFCFGFGEGVYQAYLANRSPNAKPTICFKEAGSSREMILQEFLVWTQNHPQFNQERAAKALMRFFTQAYPCK